ncbi:hypothetical protein RUR49_10270 [Pseudoxanthobacter sp. M-2]|uniref:hypothetical protein n=1 Tax=Pseudoxanthobacter sp. M-2 TaxID=3078754 RepID=UPI0038FD04D3
MAALRVLFAAAWLAGVLGSVPAFAEVTVTGDAHDLTVDAREAAVEDVIVAVAEAVGSTIEPPDDMPEALVSGVYRGSITEVLKALAPSADFFVAWRDGAVEVHFLAEGERPSIAEASPAEPADDTDGGPSEAVLPGKLGEGGGPPAPARRIY